LFIPFSTIFLLPTVNLNEVLFCHKPSRSLIVGDGFYGGYAAYHDDRYAPSAFTRLFFKTFRGGWRDPKINISRYFSVTDKSKFLTSLKEITGHSYSS